MPCVPSKAARWTVHLGLLAAFLPAAGCSRNRPAALDLLVEFGPEWATPETRFVDLGSPEARAHLRSGWSIDETDRQGNTFVWAVAERATLDFELVGRDSRERLLRLRARSVRPQRVVIEVNGQSAGGVELSQRMQEVSLPLPAALFHNGTNRLALLFSEAADAVSGDSRRLSAAVDSILLQPLEYSATPGVKRPALGGEGLVITAPARIDFVLPGKLPQTLELQLGTVTGSPDLVLRCGAARTRLHARSGSQVHWEIPAAGALPAGRVLQLEALGNGELFLRSARVVGARRPQPPKGPVLMIGVDGLGWPIADRAIARGAMPQLAALRQRGAWATLETVEPTMSIVIWTTIATGRSPQEHGIGGWMADRRRLQSGGNRRVRAIWELASWAGLRCDVVNYWATWPAAPLRGHLVSDLFRKLLFTPGIEETVYPPGLLPQLAPRLDRDAERERKGWEQAGLLRPPADRERAFSRSKSFYELFDNAEGYQAAEQLSGQVALQLLKQPSSDLTIVLLRAVDVGTHLRWHFLPPDLLREGMAAAARPEGVPRELADRLDAALELELEPILRATDRVVGQLIEAAGPQTNILLLSDHGFGFSRFGYTHHRNQSPPPGVLVLAGPAAARGQDITGASVYDVLPTLARLLGLPLSRELRGRPLNAVLRSAELPPAQTVPTYETTALAGSSRRPNARAEQNTIEELRALGYIQ